jgi:hypothetical protein
VVVALVGVLLMPASALAGIVRVHLVPHDDDGSAGRRHDRSGTRIRPAATSSYRVAPVGWPGRAPERRAHVLAWPSLVKLALIGRRMIVLPAAIAGIPWRRAPSS